MRDTTGPCMQWVDVLLENHPQCADFKCPL